MIGRLWNQIRGRISLLLSSLEFRNPEVLLENAKEDLRAHRIQMDRGLAEMATVSERLRRQIAAGEQRVRELEGMVNLFLQGGKEQQAAEAALQLTEAETDLAENRAEFEANERAYKEFQSNSQTVIKDLTKKIERLSRHISQAKVKESQAQIAEMIGGTVTKTNLASENMSRLEEAVGQKLDQAGGRLRAATDSTQFADVKMKREAQELKANAALASFMAKRGLAPKTPAAATPAAPVAESQPATPEKTLGA